MINFLKMLSKQKGEGCLLHILMGRARTGKSGRVLQRIAALGDSSQQILLVPEHASHVAEMDLCRVCGDTASRHAEALTFKLLASRVLGICGGSAIAAIAPVIEATDMDIAYGMSATFLFDTIMVVVFPLLGRAMGLSDAAFGLWAGTAVNDTSSVVATGYAFSEAAGDFATMVKLTRTLAIIPTVLVFAAISVHLKKKAAAQSGDHGVKVNMKSVFPWFILGFLAMSILCSVGVIPASLAATLKNISKFLMVAALAAIGLNTSFADLCKSGAKPMLHGFIISLLVVLVAIGVEYMLGIAPYGTLV